MNALPIPVDLERVRTMLDHQDRDFGAHGATAWSVQAHNALYLWSLENPQVLQIRGQWRGVVTSLEQLVGLQRTINHCNATRTIPKSYTLPLPEGRYGLMTECNILTHGGLSPQQFFGFCEDSLGAIINFFDEVESELPELVTWEPECE